MMDKSKMLNDEQLENVSGGGSYASADYLPATHGAHINASELYKNKDKYLNKKFYCVFDPEPNNYFIVTLKNITVGDRFKISASSNWTYSETIYVHEIHGGLEQRSQYTLGGPYAVSSYLFTFYAME